MSCKSAKRHIGRLKHIKLAKMKTLQLIGKGLFSKVYRLNEKQVLVKSTCAVKECIAMGWHSSTGVFPVIERTDTNNEYIMEYYTPVNSLKEALLPAHYEVYKELKKLKIPYTPNRHDLYAEWYKQFKTITNKKYKEALLDMVDNLTNYGGDINFEISPRNVAVKKGKLILLDVFFMDRQANEIRNSKRKRRYQY